MGEIIQILFMAVAFPFKPYITVSLVTIESDDQIIKKLKEIPYVEWNNQQFQLLGMVDPLMIHDTIELFPVAYLFINLNERVIGSTINVFVHFVGNHNELQVPEEKVDTVEDE